MGAKVLAIANQKGGVGKTTTTLSLAAALRKLKQRTLVMDLDPHACASIHLRFYPEQLTDTAYDLFQSDEAHWEDVWQRIRHSSRELPFDFVPGNIRLSELEVDLKGRTGKGGILYNFLQDHADEYDYVLLDCPPHVGILLVNALVASNLVIIPIQTDFLALHGLKLLFDTVRTLNRVLPSPIRYKALATMFDRRAGACRRVLNLLRHKMGERMFETVINTDTKFRDASAQGKTIFDVAPDSRGAHEYTLLAKEILHHEQDA